MSLLTDVLMSGTHAARPAAAASNTGRYYYETDTGVVLQSNGSAWLQLTLDNAWSPDFRHTGTNDDDFITAGTPASPWTAFNSPTAVDTHTTVKDCLYVQQADTTGTIKVTGVLKAAPSIPYTITAKMAGLAFSPQNNSSAGIFIMDGNTTSKTLAVRVENNASPWKMDAAYFSDWATFGSVDAAITSGAEAPVYLRAVVNAANNIDAYYSSDGIFFNKIGNYTNLANATYVGLGALTFQGAVYAAFDWVAFHVPSGANHTILY